MTTTDNNLKQKTAQGFAWSTFSNTSQLALNLIFGIFLARKLTPSDYGMIGLLQVFSLIASTLQDSGFRMALANRKEVRHEDYNAVFWFNVLMSSSIYIILFFLAPLITLFYEQSDHASTQDLSQLTPLARYVFLAFVISSVGTAHCAYLFRTLQVKPKAIITITSLSVSSITGIAMAWCGMAYWALATQSIVYTLSNTILFWYYSKWRPTLPVSFVPLKEMFGFSSKLLINDICNHINNNLLTIILGNKYTVHAVGIFNQANKWTLMGSNMLVGTVREVAQPVLRGVCDDKERHKRVFRKMLRLTSFITFPAMFGLALIARELILITITAKWEESIPLMQILSIGAFVFPLQYLCLNLIISKERSDIVMWNNIVVGVAQLTAALLAYPYGIDTMVWAFVGINLLWLMAWFVFVKREIGLRYREALKDIMPYALMAGGVMIATYYITFSIETLHWLLFAKIIIAAVLYTLVMWLSGSTTFKECVAFALHKNRN